MSASSVIDLATRQLAAYNRSDLDAFCACFHPEVCVLTAEGAVRSEGIAAFRATYGTMFTQHRDVRGELVARVHAGEHVVEHERWSRVDRTTNVRSEGEVLVRYTEQDGLIRWVQFFRPSH